MPRGNTTRIAPEGIRRAASNTLYCSFCGKSQHEAKKLIAGPTVFICDECAELCVKIVREDVTVAPGDRPDIDEAFGGDLTFGEVFPNQAPMIS